MGVGSIQWTEEENETISKYQNGRPRDRKKSKIHFVAASEKSSKKWLKMDINNNTHSAPCRPGRSVLEQGNTIPARKSWLSLVINNSDESGTSLPASSHTRNGETCPVFCTRNPQGRPAAPHAIASHGANKSMLQYHSRLDQYLRIYYISVHIRICMYICMYIHRYLFEYTYYVFMYVCT